MPTLQFKGKSFVKNHHLNVKYHQLIPEKEKSLTDTVSLHDNLIIHGDNLKALKALLPTYGGKIKCVLIDPPYNTGKENWVYNDNVNSPMIQEWLGKVVNREDLSRHDKWCCMMMPRLILLKELLSDDGIIYVHIDDNEQHHLKLLMDEIYGENNFIAQLTWANKEGGGGSDSEFFRVKHEYILCYSKNKELAKINGVPITNLERYTQSDDYVEIRGPYYLQKLNQASIQYSESLDFPITAPDGTVLYPNQGNKRACWRWSKDKVKWGIENGFIEFKKNRDGEWQVYSKQYLKVDNSGNPIVRTNRPSALIEEFSSTQASKLLEVIFGEKVFDYSKPYQLEKHLIRLATNENDIILDSFAGTGTTGHAVLDLNNEDENSNRHFILVELEDYANEVTAERIRRIINGVPDARDERLKIGLGGTFSYFSLGEPIEMENLLRGNSLPPYESLARYIFYTATGEEFDETKIDESRSFIGESKDYEVYLFYKPNMEYLKSTALTLERAEALGPARNKTRLVFAPMKYLDAEYMHQMKIEFAQLPFEIYRFKD